MMAALSCASGAQADLPQDHALQEGVALMITGCTLYEGCAPILSTCYKPEKQANDHFVHVLLFTQVCRRLRSMLKDSPLQFPIIMLTAQVGTDKPAHVMRLLYMA